MSELSLKVSEMPVCNAQAGTLKTEAHLRKKNKSGFEINLDENPMDINLDTNEVDEIAMRDSQPIEATSNFIGDVSLMDEEAYFVTGSSYKGSWDALGMAGVGRYVMPNGTVYEGEIRDGMFHGHGSLYWSKNQRLDVVHLRGVLQEHNYTFADGLTYQDVDWSYCRFPDRRFYESMKGGLRPGGRSLRTAKQPTKVLPAGSYDAGDGVFDPKTLCVTSYDDSTKVLRTPTMKECDWIVKNCRKSWSEPTGYQTSLIENWSDDPPELPYNLAMSKDSPDPWWKRLTTFKRDFVEDDKEKDLWSKENLELPELCICGQYVILGEPCHCMPVPVHFEIEWQGDSDEGRFYGEESSEYPKYHENKEVKSGKVSSESNPLTSAAGSSKSAVVERIIEGTESLSNNVSKIYVSANSLHISEEYQNLYSEKIVENYRALRNKSVETVNEERLLLATIKKTPDEDVKKENMLVQTELLHIDAEEKFKAITAGPKDVMEKEILPPSVKVNHEKNTEKPKYFIEDNMIPSLTRESPQNEIEEDEIRLKPHAMKKQEVQNVRSETSVEDKISMKSTDDAVKNEMLRQYSKVNNDKKIGKPKDLTEDKIQQKSAFKSHDGDEISGYSMRKKEIHEPNEEASQVAIQRRANTVEEEIASDTVKKQKDYTVKTKNAGSANRHEYDM